MAVSIVQQKHAPADGAATVTLTFDQQATSGNLLVVVYGTESRNVDTAPSGYTLEADAHNGDGGESWLYWKVSDGTETDVTIVFTGSFRQVSASFYELSPGADTWDLASTVPVTATDVGGASTTNPSGTTAAPANAKNFCAVVWGFSGARSAGSTVDNGYTLDNDGSSGRGASAHHLNQSGAQSTTYTDGGTDQEFHAGSIAVFAVDEGGVATTRRYSLMTLGVG